jgi:rubrerythrin
MVVSVDVPAAVASRLNSASAVRRWYPFDPAVVDWSVAMTGDVAYMPAGYSLFAGTGLLDHLSRTERSRVERYEITQLMRNAGHGEHLLVQGLLAMLWHIEPTDPSYRYLLHEIAEEAQHMAMFTEWVRRNPDMATTDADEASWSRELASFTEHLAVTNPEAFWVQVLLFEFVGDDFNQALRRGVGEDGRPLHPALTQIGVVHTAEEARHIAYARRWLEEGMANVDAEQRAEIAGLAAFGVQLVIDRQVLLPVPYHEQLEPLVSSESFAAAEAALPDRPATAATRARLGQLVDFFVTVGVLDAAQRDHWVEAGQLPPTSSRP